MPSEMRSQQEVPIAERETLPPPTIPEPKASEVRLRAKRRYAFAVVDVVTADLTRDPRSEEWVPPSAPAAPTSEPRLADVVRLRAASAVALPAREAITVAPPAKAKAHHRRKRKRRASESGS